MYRCCMYSQTKFRWRQVAASSSDWALDDVYIGEECPSLCSGRGDCVDGTCVCDAGYHGKCILLLLEFLHDNALYKSTFYLLTYFL